MLIIPTTKKSPFGQPMIVKPDYPDSELTGRIIGCAMRVHAELGNGFQEVFINVHCA